MNFVNKPKSLSPVTPLKVHVCRSLDGLTDGATVDWLTVCHDRVPGFLWVSRNNCRLRRYSVHYMGKSGTASSEMGKFESVAKAIEYARSQANRLAEIMTTPAKEKPINPWLADPRTQALAKALGNMLRYIEAQGSINHPLMIEARAALAPFQP